MNGEIFATAVGTKGDLFPPQNLFNEFNRHNSQNGLPILRHLVQEGKYEDDLPAGDASTPALLEAARIFHINAQRELIDKLIQEIDETGSFPDVLMVNGSFLGAGLPIAEAYARKRGITTADDCQVILVDPVSPPWTHNPIPPGQRPGITRFLPVGFQHGAVGWLGDKLIFEQVRARLAEEMNLDQKDLKRKTIGQMMDRVIGAIHPISPTFEPDGDYDKRNFFIGYPFQRIEDGFIFPEDLDSFIQDSSNPIMITLSSTGDSALAPGALGGLIKAIPNNFPLILPNNTSAEIEEMLDREDYRWIKMPPYVPYAPLFQRMQEREGMFFAPLTTGMREHYLLHPLAYQPMATILDHESNRDLMADRGLRLPKALTGQDMNKGNFHIGGEQIEKILHDRYHSGQSPQLQRLLEISQHTQDDHLRGVTHFRFRKALYQLLSQGIRA